MPNDNIQWDSEEQKRTEWAIAGETLAPGGVLAPDGTKLRRADKYDLVLMSEIPPIPLEKNKLYVRVNNGNIEYTTAGMTEIGMITPAQFPEGILPDLTDLVAAKESILAITSKSGHTPTHSFIVTGDKLLAMAGKGQVLGEGQIGKVKIAEDKAGRIYALKISTLNLSKEGEIAMDLGVAHHPVSQRQSTSTKGDPRFRSSTKYYLPYQYLGEPLKRYLEKQATDGTDGEKASQLSDDACYTLGIAYSDDVDHRFRRKWITDSDASGSLIPNDVDHSERSDAYFNYTTKSPFCLIF